ncbi:MAG: DNA mismatch repair protein MutS [Ectothiorhodospiraceae bacterium]|nr:DNA mismatch repair protein MutS [Ectothiorhodospiraceae bacterium]
MKQYHGIKKNYPDAILLFRMGDFFETFEDDAITTARVLGITLTKRSNGAASEVPLAGFPHHALDSYLPKLIRAGHRVAVCEQIEDPKQAKGIVKRDVVEVVTPGVVFTDKLLDHKQHNFLASLYFTDELAGIAFVDASTGDFFVTEMPLHILRDQLETIAPNELIIAKKDADRIRDVFGRHTPQAPMTRLDDWIFTRETAYEILLMHFKVKNLKGFGIDSMHEGVIAAGAALHYLKETQKANLPHLRSIRRYFVEEYITLDSSTRRNLELTFSMSDGTREGTLIGIMDRTSTSMGGRLLKYWMTHPLKSSAAIQQRLDAVRELTSVHDNRERLSTLLAEIVDIERLTGRICTGRANPREVIALRNSLSRIPLIHEQLLPFESHLIAGLQDDLKPQDDIVDLISETISDDPPAHLNDGGVIRHGFSPELDDLRDIATHGKQWMAKYQEEQRRETGITSLKLDYNKAFGYYITVSKANVGKVPDHYVRRQTLVNAERYITPELKEYEDKVLNAKEQILQLEAELFNDLRLRLTEFADALQRLARSIAMLDCLVCYASVALERNFVCPDVNDGTTLRIEEGRHPVVESMLDPGERFVSNDVHLDEEQQIMIITGPNMSGKSTYLRQVGLIVLLAQIGSFVPAKSAEIGVVDRIFTRVGASDNIAAGESTFLVEMTEAANILHNATPKSLVLLDEIGRGTSTFDGISIAWAISEYIHDNSENRAKTLFATHYHELNELADIMPHIQNYKVEVREYEDKVIFLRKVTKGTADHSYGIQVAQMAGLPESVIERAKDVLKSLEGQDLTVLAQGAQNEGRVRRPGKFQISLFEATDVELKEKLRRMDINNMTPLEALHALEALKRLADGDA